MDIKELLRQGGQGFPLFVFCPYLMLKDVRKMNGCYHEWLRMNGSPFTWRDHLLSCSRFCLSFLELTGLKSVLLESLHQ